MFGLHSWFLNEIDLESISFCQVRMRTKMQEMFWVTLPGRNPRCWFFIMPTLMLLSSFQVYQDVHFRGIQISAGEGSAYFSSALLYNRIQVAFKSTSFKGVSKLFLCIRKRNSASASPTLKCSLIVIFLLILYLCYSH